jgi:hypothetical protein
VELFEREVDFRSPAPRPGSKRPGLKDIPERLRLIGQLTIPVVIAVSWSSPGLRLPADRPARVAPAPGTARGERLPRRAQHPTKPYKQTPKFFPTLISHVSLQNTRWYASQWSAAKTVLKKPKNSIRANGTKVFNGSRQRIICAVDACLGDYGLEGRHPGAFGRWWCSTLSSDGGE